MTTLLFLSIGLLWSSPASAMEPISSLEKAPIHKELIDSGISFLYENDMQDDEQIQLFYKALNKGFIKINTVDENGWNLLHKSVIKQCPTHVECCGQYLKDTGGDSNVQDKEGSTPMFLAVAQKNVKLVKLLIEFDADDNCATYKDSPHRGRTPLHQAIYNHEDSPKTVQNQQIAYILVMNDPTLLLLMLTAFHL